MASDVREGRDRPAATAAGGAAMIDTLLQLLHPPPKPIKEEEAPFVDPALRDD